MPDHHGVVHADPPQALRQDRGLPVGPGRGGAVDPVAPTVPRAVHRHDAVMVGQPVAETQHRLFEVGGRAVQEHDRAAPAIRGTGLPVMQPPARDVDEAARGRIGFLDPPGIDLGEERKAPDDQPEADQPVTKNRHEGGSQRSRPSIS